jgi:ATP-binding cassette subfamily B protein
VRLNASAVAHGFAADAPALDLKSYLGVFRYSRRAVELVWSTHRGLTVALAVLSLIGGVTPAGVAFLGQLIVDSVVSAIAQYQATQSADYRVVIGYVALEGLLVLIVAGAQRGLSMCQSLLRALLGQRVNVMILEKALSMELAQFEDSEFYDKLTRARREASSRPLSLVNRTFGLLQNSISLISYAALLINFSPWAVAILVAAGLPAFVAETRFSSEAFRLFRWRAPETRMQMYLETVLAREDHAKEVKLFRLGPEMLRRYREIFAKLYKEDRNLTIRRDVWGFGLGLLSSLAFYGAYGWIAIAAIQTRITLGQMTMYLLLFRQGQTAVAAMLSAIGGMYEDNLYLSNLYEFMEQPTSRPSGHLTDGPDPDDGVRFCDVSFSYPGADVPALDAVSLHIRPGQSLALVGVNGSGKTTLIKLLAGLYTPASGHISYQGLDLKDWDKDALQAHVGIIFQDFNRYQLPVGENIGVGDVDSLMEEPRWRSAAVRGQADQFIGDLPASYQTQLGRWFRDGRELSMGQWQKVALSRAFMRTGATILVLDEPTASMDAAAESEIFEHFQALTRDRIAILISHRFSTVRRAHLIAVMDGGRVVEHGSHEELMALGGQYATLFELQARGYR